MRAMRFRCTMLACSRRAPSTLVLLVTSCCKHCPVPPVCLLVRSPHSPFLHQPPPPHHLITSTLSPILVPSLKWHTLASYPPEYATSFRPRWNIQKAVEATLPPRHAFLSSSFVDSNMDNSRTLPKTLPPAFSIFEDGTDSMNEVGIDQERHLAVDTYDGLQPTLKRPTSTTAVPLTTSKLVNLPSNAHSNPQVRCKSPAMLGAEADIL
nr:hypothetical protein CFP56_28539 [Quercus suber]